MAVCIYSVAANFTTGRLDASHGEQGVREEKL